MSARYGDDLHFSALTRVEKDLSMEINVFCMFRFGQGLLNLVEMFKTILVRIGIGKCKEGGFGGRVTEHMLEVKQELLCW